jgi:small-conductance mechanosensitive channel
MSKLQRCFIIGLMTSLLIVASGWSVFAQISSGEAFPLAQETPVETDADAESPSQPSASPASGRAVVMLGDRELFTFEAALGSVSPEDRAANASKNILGFAQDSRQLVDAMELTSIEAAQLIVANDVLLFALTEADADAAGQPLTAYAQETLNQVTTAVSDFRQDRTTEQKAFSVLKAVLSTAAAILILWGIYKLLNLIRQQINQWQDRSLETIRFQRLEFLSNRQIDRIIEFLLRTFYLALCLIILYLYIPFLLGSFPATEPLAQGILDTFWQAVGTVFDGFIGYLPNFITILIFVFIAYWINRFFRLIFRAIDREFITLPGFYQEWAKPTSNIVSVLIWALVGALIFPLLPAADSASFQGISIFIGALLTLGSSTAISNIISGIISIYTRAFQIGDRIEINGIQGEVIGKALLSIQILTPDNEVVTIPNGSIISSNIVNYAASSRDLNKPLLLKTTVTLGYDVPWRKVYEVLTQAALSTNGILADPPPIVQQTSLDDYYPSYCLRACTVEPIRMEEIYSQLHENIQDKCNEASIEILSPHYAAVRDGNLTTIPNDYLPDNYQAPGFRVDSTPD